jgi:CMP-N-acetylneuraminic acid synthetase
MNILITICARGGSKGIPGKNIKLLNNKPLISYSINAAFQFAKKFNSDVALSTDDLEILNIAEIYGLKTNYLRPANLATDQIGKIDVLRDIWEYEENIRSKKYDFFLDLDVTSPLRTLNDLSEAFLKFLENQDAISLYSVSPPNRNPYFNMVELDKNGYAYISKLLPDKILSRQAAPKVYAVNASFYFYRRCFYEKNYNTATTDKTIIYEVPHICFDLDEPIDFDFLSYLLENNKLGFIL